MTPADLIAALRKHVGDLVDGSRVNCVSIAAMTAREAGLNDLWRAFEPYEGVRMPPSKRFLRRALRRTLEPIPVAEAGPACLLLTLEDLQRRDATHVGLITRRVGDDIRLIEALATIGQVSEHPLYKDRILVEAYRIPGVDYEQR
jgi:hypothetical protein